MVKQKKQTSFTYNVIFVEFQATAPVDISEVSCGKFEDIQLERLLHKDNVVLRHAKAVEVAWVQGGAERNGANLFHLPQGWLIIPFICNKNCIYCDDLVFLS